MDRDLLMAEVSSLRSQPVKLFRIALVTLSCTAGAVMANDTPTTPEAIARSAVMKDIGANMKVLGQMAEGKAAYDASAAEAAKAALVLAAGGIEAAYASAGAEDPVSEALPEIWTNWDDFLVKANGTKAAIEAIDVASLEGIRAGMGAIGGSCKACHSDYRE